jgi:hypothetical protein
LRTFNGSKYEIGTQREKNWQLLFQQIQKDGKIYIIKL